jgi:hypothetical protein
VVQSGIAHDSAAARRCRAAAIKAASTAGNIHQADGAGVGNLCIGSSVNHLLTASHEAKQEMPIKYTEDDFILNMLHRRKARTISSLVTTQE